MLPDIVLELQLGKTFAHHLECCECGYNNTGGSGTVSQYYFPSLETFAGIGKSFPTGLPRASVISFNEQIWSLRS